MKTRFLWLAATGVILSTCAGIANETTVQLQVSSSPTPAPRPTPPPVVPYEKLLVFLPEPPEGWTSEKPSGSTTDIEVFKLSTATRTYQKGDDDNVPVTTISILDAGGHQGYFDITTSGWKFSSATPDGYDKAVEINGMRGFEHSNTAAKSSSLCVVVAKRYFVQIEVTNQEPGELREWLKKIDLKKLGELR